MNKRERLFAPENQIDLKRYWSIIRRYYTGAFFGERNGSLITVAYHRLYGEKGRLRPAIWRYVTGRQLRERDCLRLGISE